MQKTRVRIELLATIADDEDESFIDEIIQISERYSKEYRIYDSTSKTFEVCQVCYKAAEPPFPEEEQCDCYCPSCKKFCFDDVTIADHKICRDCHHKELNG